MIRDTSEKWGWQNRKDENFHSWLGKYMNKQVGVYPTLLSIQSQLSQQLLHIFGILNLEHEALFDYKRRECKLGSRTMMELI